MWLMTRGVGAGGAGGASAPSKVLISQKFGENLKIFGQKCFEIP